MSNGEGLSSTLRVGTYNVGDGPAAAKVDDLARLAEQADVFTLSEAGDRQHEIKQFLADHDDWEGYLGDGSPGAESTPILWHTPVLRRTDAVTTEAVPQRFVGPVGSGPDTIKRKVVNRVRFKHVELDIQLHVISVHGLPSVTRHDLPAREAELRQEHFTEHMRAVVLAVQPRRGLVFVAGDFNAPPDFRLLSPLREADLVCDAHLPTHHERCIDLVWHRLDERVTARGHDVMKASSDHRASVVSYQLTEA